jgi:hypothetical protein
VTEEEFKLQRLRKKDNVLYLQSRGRHLSDHKNYTFGNLQVQENRDGRRNDHSTLGMPSFHLHPYVQRVKPMGNYIKAGWDEESQSLPFFIASRQNASSILRQLRILVGLI